MSYYVESVDYSSRSDYQHSVAQQQREHAEREASALRAEAERLQGRIRDAEKAYRRAQGNYEEQVLVNQQMAVDIADLHQTQGRLRSAQRQMRQHMEREFEDMRRCQAAANQRIDCTDDSLAQLDAEYRQHVLQVEQQFQDLEAELQDGLADAERRRAAMEAELQSQIGQLDAKVEHDRAERLCKARNEMDRATAQIAIVEELLAASFGAAGLSLEYETDQVREQLAIARRHLQRNDPETALAISSDMFGRVRSLQREASRRKTELAVRQQHAVDTCRRLQQALGDKVVAKYFASETQLAAATLARIAERADSGYQRFDRLAVEAERDERDLDKLETEIIRIAAHAPAVQQQAINRNRRADKILERLRDELGIGLPDPQTRYARRGDLKSDLIVDADFGGAAVSFALPLEQTKPIRFVGHKHESNEACGAYMKKVVRVLQEQMLVQNARQDPSNPQEADLVEQSVEPSWAETSRNLDDLFRRT